eukprot:jgi/Bigna1/131748/aug1.15_g6456
MSLVNINDEEVVVVIMDFLKRKGYFKALTALENESKISMNSYGKEVSYLRRLILDGQWEDAENFLVPVKAEVTLKIREKCEIGNLGGDLERIQFLFHRQRFLELIYKQSLGNAVMELVDEVKKFEGKCSEREFQQLCYCLTLKNLNDHPDFRTWTPHRGRAICFDDVLPYIESVYGANQPFPNNGGADSDGVHSLYPSAPANNSKVGVGEMEPMRLLALIKQALLYQVDMAYRSSSKSGSPPEKVKLSIFKDFKLEAGNGTYGRSRGVSTPRTAPRGRKHLQSRHNFAPSSPNPSPSYHSNELMYAQSPDMSFRSEAKRTNRHYDKVYAPPEDSRDGRMRRRRKHRKDADENVESDDDDEAKRHRGREPKRQQQKGVIQKKAKLQLGSSGSSAAPTAISFHPSGDFVCAGTRDGKVNIVKRTRTMIPATKSGKRSPPSTSIRPVCRMTTHLGAVTCMDWCKRNPNLIATGGRDKCVRLSCLQSSSSIFNVGDASSFSPDVRSSDSLLFTLSLPFFSMEVGYHSGVVTGIGFRMKHPHIVSSGADGIINVWECTRAVKTIVEEDDEEEYGVTKGRRRSGCNL